MVDHYSANTRIHRINKSPLLSVSIIQMLIQQCETSRGQGRRLKFTGSAVGFGFGEGTQRFGVDVPQLFELPLATAAQILNVHDVRLLDPGVLPELVPDAGDEAWFVATSLEELAIQSQDLFLQLTVSGHECLNVTFCPTGTQTKNDGDVTNPTEAFQDGTGRHITLLSIKEQRYRVNVATFPR